MQAAAAVGAQRNADVVRQAFEAFEAGDEDAYVALTHDEVEFETLKGQVVRGHGELRSLFRNSSDEVVPASPVEDLLITPQGDYVLATGRLAMRGQVLASIDLPMAWAFRIEDGLIREGVSYAHPSQASRAVGRRSLFKSAGDGD